jgi:uncharacterized protein YaaQ
VSVIDTLLTAVVQLDDAPKLITSLTERGYGVTRIDSSGGFLREGNAIVLLGLSIQDVGDVLAAIRQTCSTRTSYVTPPSGDPTLGGLVLSIYEVQVGGAVVFVLPIDRWVRLDGGWHEQREAAEGPTESSARNGEQKRN